MAKKQSQRTRNTARQCANCNKFYKCKLQKEYTDTKTGIITCPYFIVK